MLSLLFVNKINAQTCESNNRAQGLVSATNVTGFGNTEGKCVVDPKAAYSFQNIPTYNDLKSLYFTRSKATKPTPLPTPPAAFNTNFTVNGVYNYGIDLTIDTTNTPNPAGTGIVVIFVDGNLNINSDIDYHPTDANGGLVFVVRGVINIDYAVKRIDAVLIAEGNGTYSICTAVERSAPVCPADYHDYPTNADKLVVNGSFITLNSNSPIRFRRSLPNNSTDPAELINQQAKYLVILKDLFSHTLEIRSEL